VFAVGIDAQNEGTWHPKSDSRVGRDRLLSEERLADLPAMGAIPEETVAIGASS
jgi:hypothetical protein